MTNDKPDTSARDAAAEAYAQKQGFPCKGENGGEDYDCYDTLMRYEIRDYVSEAWLAGHARALKEMGAEVERLRGESKRYFGELDSVANALAAAELKAAEYEKALEHYANYENWRAVGYGSDEFDVIEKTDSEKRRDRDNDIIGGKRARTVLVAHRRGGES